MKDFEIIATVNTKNIGKFTPHQFASHGATIFRINSAFLEINTIKHQIDEIRATVGRSVRILIDLPGYKVRFLYLDKNINFKSNVPFVLKKEYFNYPDFVDLIDAGSIMRVNNGFNLLTVSEKKKDSITCVADSSGTIIKGKGVHVDDKSYRPSRHILSAYDLDLVGVINKCDIDYIGLSYIHDMEDVRYVESKLSSSKIKCIPKIESKESIHNLEGILQSSEVVIVDRGDLSGEIGLENIWKTQKEIISLSKLHDCKVVLATQVLASMTGKPLPTIAEVDSLYSLLDLGIDGIQLSEETSLGRYGKECISFITDAVRHFRQGQKAASSKMRHKEDVNVTEAETI